MPPDRHQPDGAGTAAATTTTAQNRTRRGKRSDPAPESEQALRSGLGVNDTPVGQLCADLWIASDWRAIARLLVEELKLQRSELARGANVKPSTVTKWLDPHDHDPIRSHEGLGNLRYVVVILLRSGHFELQELRFWLTTRDPILADQLPDAPDVLTAVGQGHVQEVIDAGQRLGTLRHDLVAG